jgi:hypothetical protein
MLKTNVQKGKIVFSYVGEGTFVFETLLIRQDVFKDPHWITDRETLFCCKFSTNKFSLP